LTLWQQTTVFDRSKLKNQIVEQKHRDGRKVEEEEEEEEEEPVFPRGIGNNPLLTRASNHPHCSRIPPGLPNLPTQLSPGKRKATIKGKICLIRLIFQVPASAFLPFLVVFLVYYSLNLASNVFVNRVFLHLAVKNCLFMPNSATVFVILCNCTSSASQFVSQS
jgi:hypothetical protein